MSQCAIYMNWASRGDKKTIPGPVDCAWVIKTGWTGPSFLIKAINIWRNNETTTHWLELIEAQVRRGSCFSFEARDILQASQHTHTCSVLGQRTNERTKETGIFLALQSLEIVLSVANQHVFCLISSIPSLGSAFVSTSSEIGDTWLKIDGRSNISSSKTMPFSVDEEKKKKGKTFWNKRD